MSGYLPSVLVLGLLAVSGCVQSPITPSQPAKLEDVFALPKLRSIGGAITKAQEEKRLPGGVLWVESNGVPFTEAYGKASVEPVHFPAHPDTIYDAASLTKVVATTTAVLLLHERGNLSIDDPVKKHLPEFTGGGRDAVTLRHLLTHTSGLRPDISLAGWNGHAECIAKCVAEKLKSKPGQKLKYSDINFQLLDEIIRRVTKRRLDLFCEMEIFGPLKMTDTGYNPPAEKRNRVAPTTVKDGKALQGIVHDPRARKTEGVAGHAGLFTTAPDLAHFARMLLQKGELDDVRLFKPETVKLMTTVQTTSGLPLRGLGWDIDSGYSSPRGSIFPLGSYGHTGFTGTSIWIDPFSKTFVIFLCNRVHPTEKGAGVSPLRRVIGTLVAEAVKGFDYDDVPDALPARNRSPNKTP